MKITPIEEQRYGEVMNQTVLPQLETLREEGTFERVPGQPIYYALYRPSNVARWLVISHGFVESGIKYAELIWYFTRQGYGVAILDHRGHGKSYRPVEVPWITHVDRFYDYAEDFACFLKRIVMPAAAALPVYLLGHSMGGAIAALTLMRHPHLRIHKLVLSSPMIAPKTQGLPRGLSYGLTRFFILTGREKCPIFTQKPFSGVDEFHDPLCCATSYSRYCWYLDFQRNHEEYQNTAPSYRWAEEALLVTRTLLKPANCQKLRLPVLLLQAGRDQMVENGAQNRFAQRLPDCRVLQFPTAKHEIFRSENRVVQEFVESIGNFLEQ